MRFALTDEQRGFAGSLDDLLGGSDVPKVARDWADGKHDLGLHLWSRLAELGVHGLLVDERYGGLGADPVDLVVAFEQLGRHAVPGPWVESVAFLPAFAPTQEDLVGPLAAGQVATVAAPPHTPFALDADVAARALLVEGPSLRPTETGELHRSVDPTRRLFDVSDVAAEEDAGRAVDAGRAFDLATLACSAQLLGAGERLLGESVEYARTRRQFGRAIGEFQALKHAMADVSVGLDFARPLIYGAALSIGGGDASRDVSAAKVAAGDSAYRAARTALQVHGAIGYTAEHDLGLWITKVRALVGAWGTPSFHRARVLDALVEPTPVVEPVETRGA